MAVSPQDQAALRQVEQVVASFIPAKTKQRVGSWARQGVAIAGLVVGYLQTNGTIAGGKAGTVFAAIGGIILAVEHFVGDPSTGK